MTPGTTQASTSTITTTIPSRVSEYLIVLRKISVFPANQTGCRAGNSDGLGRDQFAGDTAEQVRRGREHRVYACLSGGDLLQLAEQSSGRCD